MGWGEIKIESIEQVEDKNPNLYVKRAEQALVQGRGSDAVREIGLALEYCTPDQSTFFLYEKAKVLAGARRKGEFADLICAHLKDFYRDFDITKFKAVLATVEKSRFIPDQTLRKFLSDNKIPSIVLENDGGNTYDDFIRKANKEKNEGNYQRANEYAQLALKLRDSSEAYFILGYSYDKLNNKSEALDSYTKAIDHNSQNAAAHNNLATIWSSMGKSTEALKGYIRAVELAPDEVLYLNNKLSELIKLGMYQDAVDCLKPKIDGTTYWHIGRAYDGLRKYLKARKFYRMAVSIDPSCEMPNHWERDQFLSSYRKRILIVWGAIAIVVVVGGGTHFGLYHSGKLSPQLKKLEVSPALSFIEVDQVLELKESHSIFPPYGVDRKVTFQGANDEVISVTPEGKIKGLKEGKATIFVLFGDVKTDEIQVEVRIAKIVDIDVPTEKHLMVYGDKTYLSPVAVMKYSGATKPTFKYTSSDPKIVKVTDDGQVEATGAGSAEIVVQAGEIKKVIPFEIAGFVKFISFDKKEFELSVGTSMTLVPKIEMSPPSATEPLISFQNMSPKQIVVDETGTVKAISTGTATVRVKSGGISDEVRIIITEAKKAPLTTSNVSPQPSVINNTKPNVAAPSAKELQSFADQLIKLSALGTENSTNALMWPQITGAAFYEVYAREIHNGESEFKLVQTVASTANPRYPVTLSKVYKAEFYVVGVWDGYRTQKSNIITISQDIRDITELKVSGINIDYGLTRNSFDVSWTTLPQASGYEIYGRNVGKGEKGFSLLKKTVTKSYGFRLTEQEDSFEVYVIGVSGSKKSAPSDVLTASYLSE